MKKFTRVGRHGMFDIGQVAPVSNSERVKPFGGLWLSVNDGWERWCSGNMPEWLVGERLEISLAPEAHILWITEEEQLEALPDNPKVEALKELYGFEFDEKFIDFEAVAEEYDGIAIMVQSGDPELYMRVYGWDCDSVLIFRPELIASWREIPAYEQ